MPPCPRNNNTVSSSSSTPSYVKDKDETSNETTMTSSSTTRRTIKSSTDDDPTMVVVRPFPWNTFSDATYKWMGFTMLLVIIIPSLVVITLANVVGYLLEYVLVDKCTMTRHLLNQLRVLQQYVFQCVGHYVLLDPRDYSYLSWMTWGNVVQPALFVWAAQRYLHQDGTIEIWVFLIYHLLRVGPKHKCFAHHATLVHKEGHALRRGLYCNPFSNKRSPLPRWIRRCVLDHVVAGLSGLLYGTIANHYATAHLKIHHRWHNDTGDVHTNMDFDRTLLTSYLMYLPRFMGYWTGFTPLLLFWSRKEYALFTGLAWGMVYYYSVSALLWYKMGFWFYWAYMLYPLMEGASFLGIIAYLWHCFSEESDPTNQYINSITILRGGTNVWNEDYHVVHHHEPNVHWTDMPANFEENLDHYVKCRATVFGDTEQGEMIYYLFGAKWDMLANCFIDLQYKFKDGSLNSDKDKRFTVQQIAQMKEEHDNDNDNGGKQHHAQVKELLLRRLKYHYMGTREDEWREYQTALNAGVRDFEKSD